MHLMLHLCGGCQEAALVCRLAIACYLVFLGDCDALEAVAKVRQGRPGALQTHQQEHFVQVFQMYLTHLRSGSAHVPCMLPADSKKVVCPLSVCNCCQSVPYLRTACKGLNPAPACITRGACRPASV